MHLGGSTELSLTGALLGKNGGETLAFQHPETILMVLILLLAVQLRNPLCSTCLRRAKVEHSSKPEKYVRCLNRSVLITIFTLMRLLSKVWRCQWHHTRHDLQYLQYISMSPASTLAYLPLVSILRPSQARAHDGIALLTRDNSGIFD